MLFQRILNFNFLQTLCNLNGNTFICKWDGNEFYIEFRLFMHRRIEFGVIKKSWAFRSSCDLWIRLRLPLLLSPEYSGFRNRLMYFWYSARLIPIQDCIKFRLHFRFRSLCRAIVGRKLELLVVHSILFFFQRCKSSFIIRILQKYDKLFEFFPYLYREMAMKKSTINNNDSVMGNGYGRCICNSCNSGGGITKHVTKIEQLIFNII